VLITAICGILLVSAGLQGYLVGVGDVGRGPLGWTARLSLALGGATLAAPGGGMIGIGHTELTLIAVAVAAPGVLTAIARARSRSAAVP
ncbi:MAG: TRAP transporter permease, partial [Gammaproteobacteria bacterium]|nr:TRAP transporter permease [Gammaproteobacteria bacterium]